MSKYNKIRNEKRVLGVWSSIVQMICKNKKKHAKEIGLRWNNGRL